MLVTCDVQWRYKCFYVLKAQRGLGTDPILRQEIFQGCAQELAIDQEL